MKEIELRFQVGPEALDAVGRWVRGSGDAQVHEERLQAVYFDTEARDLAQRGFALRLRREGEVWVQTLKGAAPDGMSRLEHNVTLGRETPSLEVSRHADHPAGQALQRLLATLPPDALQALFRTDIQRQTRALQTPHGTVELAFDQGALLAGEGAQERRAPVSELEIELKEGHARAVLETAREWAIEHFGLTLELRTKALRGDLLARGQRCAPVATARGVRWSASQSRDEALRQLLTASVEPILGNASQLLTGEHQPQHLHQLRVALRRLRVGVALLAAEGEAALHALERGAAELSRALSAARDGDAQAAAEWRLALDTAWQAVRPSAAVDASPAAALPVAPLLAGPEVQGWMLAIIGWIVRLREAHDPHDGSRKADAPAPITAVIGNDEAQPGAPSTAVAPAAVQSPEAMGMERVQQRLTAWRQSALKALKRLERLDVEARHHLRRRLRRLRLGLDLALELPDGTEAGKRSRDERQLRTRLLAKVHAAQQALGAANDIEVALAHAREQLALAMAHSDASAAARCGFALGFLEPQRQSALSTAVKAAKVLRRL